MAHVWIFSGEFFLKYLLIYGFFILVGWAFSSPFGEFSLGVSGMHASATLLKSWTRFKGGYKMPIFTYNIYRSPDNYVKTHETLSRYRSLLTGKFNLYIHFQLQLTNNIKIVQMIFSIWFRFSKYVDYLLYGSFTNNIFIWSLSILICLLDHGASFNKKSSLLTNSLLPRTASVNWAKHFFLHLSCIFNLSKKQKHNSVWVLFICLYLYCLNQ